MFSEEGFEVLEAEHAAAALSAFGVHPNVQVLFTDVNMPGTLDGIDLAEQLKAMAPELQVIITSALPLPRPAGHIPAFFVSKPYDTLAVCDAAKALLAA